MPFNLTRWYRPIGEEILEELTRVIALRFTRWVEECVGGEVTRAVPNDARTIMLLVADESVSEALGFLCEVRLGAGEDAAALLGWVGCDQHACAGRSDDAYGPATAIEGVAARGLVEMPDDDQGGPGSLCRRRQCV